MRVISEESGLFLKAWKGLDVAKKVKAVAKKFNLACLRCDLWWYVRKQVDQQGYEKAQGMDLSHIGKWAGYHRYMYIRRAQEVREMSLKNYINQELRFVLSNEAVIAAASGDETKLFPSLYERELDV